MHTTRRAAIAVTIALLTAGIASSIGPLSAAEEPGCEQHPPIAIVGDEGPTGFALADPALTGQALHRPGSGVRAGTGTAEDPYVISGWCFSPPPAPDQQALYARAEQAILIQATDAHVVVEDNTIEGHAEIDFAHGIAVQDASNVTIRENTITGVDRYGIGSNASQNLQVEDNDILANGWKGIHLEGGQGPSLTGNRIEASPTAIGLMDTTGASIASNEITAEHVGLEVSGGEDVFLEANVLSSIDEGLLAEEISALAAVDNRFTDVGQAAEVTFVDDVFLEANHVNGTGDGFDVRYGDTAHVRENLLEDQGVGLVAEGIPGLWIEENQLVNVSSGITLNEVEDAQILANELTDGNNGIFDTSSTSIRIAGNTIENHSHFAVSLSGTQGSLVEANTLQSNGDGIGVYQGFGHTIEANHIEDHERNGLFVASLATPLDASDNWWGDASGPSSASGTPIEDACTEDVFADGDGEAIETQAASVCFAPWMQAPPGS